MPEEEEERAGQRNNRGQLLPNIAQVLHWKELIRVGLFGTLEIKPEKVKGSEREGSQNTPVRETWTKLENNVGRDPVPSAAQKLLGKVTGALPIMGQCHYTWNLDGNFPNFQNYEMPGGALSGHY